MSIQKESADRPGGVTESDFPLSKIRRSDLIYSVIKVRYFPQSVKKLPGGKENPQ
jgi:hypothetical protein